jgi:Fe-S cluster biogenesis protein NfuA
MTQPDAPTASDATPASLEDRVAAVLETIRPAIQADGGDIELVKITDEGVVQIRFHGACVGCPSSSITLQMGIQRLVLEKVPEVSSVVPVP